MISPPTDNLYKFCAITGIIIIILSFYIPSSKIQDLGIEIAILETESDILEIDTYFLNNKLGLRGIDIKNQTNLNDFSPENLELLKEYKINRAEHSGKIKIVKQKLSWINIYLIVGIVFGLLSVFLAKYGFENWRKIQIKLDNK